MRTCVVVGLVLLASCKLPSLGGEGDDAGAPAASAAPIASSAPSAVPSTPPAATPPPDEEPDAKNAGQLTRFATETKLGNAKGALDTKPANSVREDPPLGKVTAVLAKGTQVIKIAQADVMGKKWTLVNFASPTDAKDRLAGWVPDDSFSAPRASVAVAAPKTAPKCAAGLSAIWGEAPSCERVCTKAEECGAGNHCFGVAPLLTNGAPGKAVKYCVGENVHHAATLHVVRPDAGAATTATTAPVVDASAPTAATATDAGPLAVSGAVAALLAAAQDAGLTPKGDAKKTK